MDRLRVSRATLAFCLTAAAAPPVSLPLPSPASAQAGFRRATAFPFLENS